MVLLAAVVAHSPVQRGVAHGELLDNLIHHFLARACPLALHR